MTDATLQPWLTIWLVAASYMMVRYWRRNSGAGLVFTYVLTFGVMHWMAAALYLLPWHYDARVELTALGLRESAIGMVAMVIGSEVAALFLAHRIQHWPPLPDAPRPIDRRLTRLYLVCGAALYVGLFPLAGRLPSVEAILSSGSTIAVVAISLLCWNAWALGRPARLWGTLAASCLLPVVTVIGQGFLGTASQRC